MVSTFPLSGLLLPMLLSLIFMLAGCEKKDLAKNQLPQSESLKSPTVSENQQPATPTATPKQAEAPQKSLPFPAIVAVLDNQGLVPGVVLKDVPFDDDSTKKISAVIAAKLTKGTMNQKVVFYSQAVAGGPALPQSGIISGFDSSGELSLIVPSGQLEGMAIPAEPKIVSSLISANIDFSTTEKPLEDADPKSPKLINAQQVPPVPLTFSIVTDQQTTRKQMVTAVRYSEDLKYLDIQNVEAGRTRVYPMANMRITVPKLVAASVRFEIGRDRISVFEILETKGQSRWKKIKQVIIPHSELQNEELLTAQPPVSILGSADIATMSQRTGSAHLLADKTPLLRQEVPFSPAKNKERFIGQHIAEDKDGNLTFFPPFAFTLYAPPAVPVELEPHPYLGLATFKDEDQPVNLFSAHHILKSDAKVKDLATLCSGDLLAVSLETAPFLKFVDLKTNTWISPIAPDLDEPVLITSQEDKLFILHPSRGIVERWNLSSGAMEKALLIGTDEPVRQIAAPISNRTGSICVLAGKRIFLINPQTLKEVASVSSDRASDLLQGSSQRTQITASGDGFAYSIINETKSQTSTQARGGSFHCLENYEGYFRAGELFILGASASLRFGQPGKAFSFVSPDAYGSCWLKLDSKERSDLIRFPEQTPIFDLVCSVPGSTEPLPIAKIGSLAELKALPSEISLEGPPPNRRRVLLMDKRKLITLASNRNEIHLRDLNLQDTVASKGLGLILSSPASYTRRGELYTYQLVSSLKSPPTFTLQQAPQGAKLSSSGLLEWFVDPLFEPKNADFSINIETPGESQSYKFQVQLIGPGPGSIRIVPPANSERCVKVAPKQIVLPTPIVRTIVAGGGKYLVGSLMWPHSSLAVLDLEAGRVAATLPMPDKYYAYVANRDFVFIADFERSIVEARNLKDLKLAASWNFKGRLCALATGYASTAPLFLLQNEAKDNESPLTLGLVAPATLTRSPLGAAPEIAKQLFNSIHRHGFNELATSPDGTMYETLGSGNAAKRFEIRGSTITSINPISPRDTNKNALIEEVTAAMNAGTPAEEKFYSQRLFRSTTGASSNLVLGGRGGSSFMAFAPGREDVALVLDPLMECDTSPNAILIDDAGFLVGICGRCVIVYPWTPREWFQQLSK